MILTIVGIILLLSPFLLISKFNNKRLGFVYILSFVIAFHLFTAIVTQLFHVFNYPVIFSINTATFLIVVLKTDWKKIFQELKLNLRKIDWVLFFVLAIVFISLFSIHYNYSGKFTTITTPEYQTTEDMKYPYPYYADEWYAISFVKDSIDSHSLPFKNSLSPPPHDSMFINLEFASHSFLAELMLLLHLDPLTDYTIFTIFSGLLICLLIYLFLKHSNVNKFSASIISLSTLYLINGANLPGIWYLTPLILGIIPILLSFFFVSIRDKKMVFFMAVITLLFYPPLVVFYSLSILFLFVLPKETSFREKIKNISFYLILTVLTAVVLSASYFLTQNHQNNFFDYIFSKIFYPTFTANAIPSYSIYNIIPIPILILAILGTIRLVIARKKIWLLSMLFLGLAYWALYSQILFRFIIEYQRVIVFTSILVVITAGFGLNYLIKILKKTDLFKENNILNYIQIGVLIIFLAFSFNYTKEDNWQKLRLVYLESGKVFLPAAPANKYLHPDDFRLFKDIRNQKFLSLPWKGTVIGVATDNYPLATKSGTITINRKLPSEFMDMGCDEKDKIAKNHDLSYVYFPKFNCPNFEFIDMSSEGLYLYKFSDNPNSTHP